MAFRWTASTLHTGEGRTPMNFHRSCLAVMLFATMIAVGSAYADCSNASLKGAYGVSLSGSYGGAPAVVAGQFVFDGKKKVVLTLTFNTSIGVGRTQLTQDYFVRSNCTGVIDPTFNFVLDNNNKGFQMVFLP